MKKILVTGSAGFIGFHVSQKLLDLGYEVVGIDNFNNYYNPQLKKERNQILKNFSSFSAYQGDITDKELLDKIINNHKIDSICNLAAQAGVRYSLLNPKIYVDSNIKGFINILEFARENKISNIVYASSSSVYGNNTMPINGFSEKDPVNSPVSVYAMTKRSNELTAYLYNHLYSIKLIGLRFFTVYGPWGRPDMAYYKFTESIYKGETIEVFNNGNMKRDFTYIEDAVSGIISALNKDYSQEVFNIGNSNIVNLMYFISLIEKYLGKKAKVKYLPLQAGDLRETYANISHAKEKLDYSPKVSIEDGIKIFVDWYLKYKKV